MITTRSSKLLVALAVCLGSPALADPSSAPPPEDAPKVDVEPEQAPPPPKKEVRKPRHVERTHAAKTHASAPTAGPTTGKTSEDAGRTPQHAAETKAAPAIVPDPAPPQGAGEAPGEFEPVLHARGANITTCMDNIVDQSARAIDRPHKAASTWASKAPNDNMFSSIVALSYPNRVAPHGVAVIAAAPLEGKKCQGQTVQIYPTAASCTSVQASLLKGGHTVATLQDLPLLQLADGARSILMPTAGGGCVLVSVRFR